MIIILGGCILKHLNGWKMSKKVKSDYNIFVKHFLGATTSCMEVYMKLSLRKDPNHVILHVATNDLILERTSQDIATSIVNLVFSVNGKDFDTSMSNIVLRPNNKVNTHLKDMYKEKNIYMIDNTKKIKLQHINKGRRHLNKRSSNVPSSTFISELSRILT